MHTIAILHVPGCAGGRQALREARAVAAGREDVTIEDVIVEDEATALAAGFRGSPTVLIDGRDFEPDTEIPLGSMG